MKLKAVIERLEDVDEKFRDLYEEARDGGAKGKFVLSVEGVGGYALEDVQGLRTALERERGDGSRASSDLKKLRSILGDRDPSKLVEAFEAMEKLEGDLTQDARFKTALEKRVGDMKSKLEKERDEAKTLAEQREDRIRRLVLDRDLGAAIAAGKGDVELLLDKAAQFARVEVDDAGQYRTIILDDDRKNARMTRKSGSTDTMGPKEFVESVLRDKYPRAFEGYASPGSGATGGAGGTGGSAFTLTKSQARDPALYQQKREQAMKAGQQLQIVDG